MLNAAFVSFAPIKGIYILSLFCLNFDANVIQFHPGKRCFEFRARNIVQAKYGIGQHIPCLNIQLKILMMKLRKYHEATHLKINKNGINLKLDYESGFKSGFILKCWKNPSRWNDKKFHRIDGWAINFSNKVSSSWPDMILWFMLKANASM